MNRRGLQRGFTLLEIMVAIAILSATLGVLLRIVTNNVRSTNHAKMTTAATFLARTKMVDIEDEILDNGFTDQDDSAAGTFKELGYPQFRWETLVERIELPADMAQKSKDQATDQSMDAKNPMSLLTGFMGSMMSSFIEPVRAGLQESVRKVTVRVLWDEHGRRDQSFEVVQYLTDPAKLDAAMNLNAGAGSGTNGSGGSTGSTGAAAQNPLNALQGLLGGH
ncbi:MAG TPA: type II secretion system protein [Polyangia bacterium]|nr:type II secretion system protein [Polyangia bacterium]